MRKHLLKSFWSMYEATPFLKEISFFIWKHHFKLYLWCMIIVWTLMGYKEEEMT